MSIQEDGITLSPKILLAMIAVGGILITIGGYVAVVKDAPKDISALTLEHRGFEKEAGETHKAQWREISGLKITQTKLETNQGHMMRGIDDIKGMLRRSTRRRDGRSGETR